MTTITLMHLKKAGACANQVAQFKELFGAGVVVTRDLCLQHADVFDWGWGARELLPAPASAEYDRAVASACAEYDRAVASARAEYQRAKASACAEYDRAVASAFFDCLANYGLK